jgi:hypothetical protein
MPEQFGENLQLFVDENLIPQAVAEGLDVAKKAAIEQISAQQVQTMIQVFQAVGTVPGADFI